MSTTTEVKLSRRERDALLTQGRRAGDIDGAADVISGALFDDLRFAHLPATVISDYAWAAARFCFPREAD
jgi:hypothetical protein